MSEISERYAEACASCIIQRAAMRELLRRLRQWDMLDSAADGDYWKAEIDKVME